MCCVILNLTETRTSQRKVGFYLYQTNASLFDPVIIGAAVSRELHYLGEDTYFHIPGIGWLLTRVEWDTHKTRKTGAGNR